MSDAAAAADLLAWSSAPHDLISVVTLDDDADFRWLLRRALQRAGDFDVVAETAEESEAVELVRAEHPHAVLVGCPTPSAPRVEVVRRLRAVAPKTLLVALALDTSSAVVDPVLLAGAATVIRKGSSLTSLVAQLRLALGAVHPDPILLG